MSTFRIALAQINPTVGDLSGNRDKIVAFMQEARKAGAELVAFPELALTGYPPEDLLLNPEFIEAGRRVLDEVVAAADSIVAIVGFPDGREDIYNAAAIIHGKKLAAVYHKMYLPNYGVFDEARYFQAGSEPLVVSLNGISFGVNICEDIWYPAGPAKAQALEGDAQLIMNISASPYHAGKGEARRNMLSTRASDNAVIVAFCNLVGGQDELVFDGGSVVFEPNGELLAEAKQFEEDLLLVDLSAESLFRRRLHNPRRRQEKTALRPETPVRYVSLQRLPPHEKTRLPARKAVEPLSRDAEIYAALVLGLRDYIGKNGLEKAVVAVSGGIDSALTATIAVDALGRENVVAVSMPSEYSSPETQADAKRLAGNLGVELMVLPISSVFHSSLDALKEAFEGLEDDATEENLQARIRGNLIMALSNKFGWLPLATGNKSEISVGYCTLYGDMVGGFGVLKDVPKTVVYELAGYRNSVSPAIPESIIQREPSAELKEDQRDTDSLPPYEALDPILRAYVEDDMSRDDIVAGGHDEETVDRVIEMVHRSEYKRRQAAPGIKITPRAFGKDRRWPITNRFKPR